jgi:integrase
MLDQSTSERLDAYQIAARVIREGTKDKSYRAYPMGGEAGAYLRWKRGRITASTYRDYESCLDKLARVFPDLEIGDFEPPIGTQRLEEFLDRQWGDGAPRTYNKNLSVVKDFFKWAVLKGRLHGDPSLPLVPHKKRDVHREIFVEDIVASVIAAQEDRRDRICLRLLFYFGIRKGALRAIQFKHFDHARRALTVFTKGEKIRTLRLPDDALWNDLDLLKLEIGAEEHHYLLNARKSVFWKYDELGKPLHRVFQYPERPMSEHGAHDWWYGCLERGGVVSPGTTRGEKMHKARHTAGQRVLDKTGNIKAVQKLLGHASPTTTMETYVDWDDAQLEATMREVLGG